MYMEAVYLFFIITLFVVYLANKRMTKNKVEENVVDGFNYPLDLDAFRKKQAEHNARVLANQKTVERIEPDSFATLAHIHNLKLLEKQKRLRPKKEYSPFIPVANKKEYYFSNTPSKVEVSKEDNIITVSWGQWIENNREIDTIRLRALSA